MSHYWQSAAKIPRVLALGAIIAANLARAHDTLSFDPNAPPEFPLGKNTMLGAPEPVVIQGMAVARLRPHDFEIDLTVADNAAYRLLDVDPYQEPAGPASPAPSVDNSSGLPVVHDPHFDADKALLVKRGESLFIIKNNGETLDPLAVAVDLTDSQNVVFHITYPRISPGSLRLFITYFNQVPTGQKDMVTVIDDPKQPPLASLNVGAQTPYLDVDVPGPVTKQAATPANPLPIGSILAALSGIVAGLVVLIFLLQRLRRPEGA